MGDAGGVAVIIWAGSFPRSGSTLFRIAWHTYTGLPTYSYADDPVLQKGWLDPYIGQRPLPVTWDKVDQIFEPGETIHLVKTHMDVADVDPGNTMCKILIVRDIRDALVSLAHYTSRRKGGRFKREIWRLIRAEKWAAFVRSWTKVSRAIVRYENLRSEPQATLATLLDSLEIKLPLREREMPGFEMLHEAMPVFFRKGLVGEWRDALTAAQEGIIWNSCGEQMERLGYER